MSFRPLVEHQGAPVCENCSYAILDNESVVQWAPCGHKIHAQCLVEAYGAGEYGCRICGGQKVLDVGNDGAHRARALADLQFHRTEVRTAMIRKEQGANAVTGVTTWYVAHVPTSGGMLDRGAPATCTQADCLDPRVCAHAIYVTSLEAYECRVYQRPPLFPVGRRGDVLRRLLAKRTSPADLRRLGYTGGISAVLDVPLSEYMKQRYFIEDLITELALDWPALIAMGFTADCLRNRLHFPVAALAQLVTSDRLLQTFALTYEDVYDWRLTATEVYVLGFSASQLCKMGIRGEELADLTSTAGVEVMGGVRWFVQAFRLGATWLAALPTDRELIDGSPELHTLYTRLQDETHYYQHQIR